MNEGTNPQHQRDNTFKSRDLSTLEYLRQLNQEWWICNLRRKIYPRREDKAYYNRVANLKRDRIKEICERNEIESIFDNKTQMRELNKFFMRAGGMPIFDEMTELDVTNYYLPDNDCRVFFGMEETNKPKIQLGKIKELDYNAGIVVVTFETPNPQGNLEDNYTITQVSRIF